MTENVNTEFLVNDHIIGLKPSATLLINEQSKNLIAKGEVVYKLGFGQSPFPVPKVVVEALKNNAHQKDYLPVKGLFDLRESVANYHARKHGLTCDAEDVFIGPGSKELLFLCQLIYCGELLIPQPSWVSYEPQAQLANKKFSWIPTDFEDGHLLNAVKLDEHCMQSEQGSKILILNYPSNPTGSSLSVKSLEEIAVVAKKHNLLVLSDEIYGEMHHDGNHHSIAKYYPEGTIVSSGLSKWAGAGGWRLGTFTFPKRMRWLLDKMGVVASETFSATSAPIQYAAIAAFNGGEEIDQYLKSSRSILKIIAAAGSTILTDNNIKHNLPVGGFYLMPTFNNYKDNFQKRNIITSVQLCDSLLKETGVALLPLSAFGMPEDFLGARLSYVDFDGAKAIELIESNPEAKASELAPKVMEAFHLMAQWTSEFN